MKQLLIVGLGLGILGGVALADVKNTVQVTNVECTQGTLSNGASSGLMTQWTDALHTTIATSNSTSLFADASLVSGLLTDTTVTGGGTGGKNGTSSQATATGSIQVEIVLDATCGGAPCSAGQTPDPNTGTVFAPGAIDWNFRLQQLTASLGSICTETAGIVTCTTPESIELLLETLSANSFTFVASNVGVTPNSAPHSVDVFYKINNSTSVLTGSGTGTTASVAACVGAGTLTIDVVRLGHGFSCNNNGCSAQ